MAERVLFKDARGVVGIGRISPLCSDATSLYIYWPGGSVSGPVAGFTILGPVCDEPGPNGATCTRPPDHVGEHLSDRYDGQSGQRIETVTW